MVTLRYAYILIVASLVAAVSAFPGTALRASQGSGQAAGRPVTGPIVKLIVTQRQVTAPQAQGMVFLDPGVWLAASGSDLEFRVSRSSYATPPTITQVIPEAKGRPVYRRLPASLIADGWVGLADFFQISVRTAATGKLVSRQQMVFCPDSYNPQRASPAGPMTSRYPWFCSSGDPFPLGEVWGISRGWAVDPAQTAVLAPFQLRLGTYKVTMTITSRYVSLLHVSAKDASATVMVRVVEGSQPIAARTRLQVRGSPLPLLPQVRTLHNPAMSARPDLVPLPAFLISTSHTQSGQDLLNFAATVWVGGSGPLDVEGFRVPGTPVMKAYQYFWQDGHAIGRAGAGTMEFDSQKGHNHWHFEQFAQYRLLAGNKKLAVRSHKVGFCIDSTDNVDLTLPHATWQPSTIGLAYQCGLPGALWVREDLPIGWGDTYLQEVAGQSFDITKIPNGTYYIELIANPEHLLYETNTHNDVSLRKVILGGSPGHRAVKVPPWNGIDPEP